MSFSATNFHMFGIRKVTISTPCARGNKNDADCTSQLPTEVNNRVQSLLLNYHFVFLRSGDFTLVYYQMGELEYIRKNDQWQVYSKTIDIHVGGGRKRLPKFKFSAKFPIGLHVILQIQIKKIRKWLLYCVKNYFNRKSVEVQPCTPLEIMLNAFCLKIIR